VIVRPEGESAAMKNPYQTLGLDPKCDADAIKKAYRKLALKEHPDRGGNEERYDELH
jgi:curved DNA-binding protein CbpA